MKSPFEKVGYDGLVDDDLERRELTPLDQITNPEEQALALLQDALFRLIDVHVTDDEGERSRKLAPAVQVIVVAARLPLQAQIAQLEARHAALEATPR